MARRDDPEKMARMHAWLAQVCSELELPPDIFAGLDTRMLSLVAKIAHGPTRPGGPLTMYAVGLAVAGGADVDDTLARLETLVGTRGAD